MVLLFKTAGFTLQFQAFLDHGSQAAFASDNGLAKARIRQCYWVLDQGLSHRQSIMWLYTFAKGEERLISNIFALLILIIIVIVWVDVKLSEIHSGPAGSAIAQNIRLGFIISGKAMNLSQTFRYTQLP